MTCRGIPGITCYPCEGGTKRLPLFFSIISHRATIVTQFQNPGAPTIPVNGIRASFFSCKTVPRRTELYSLSIRRGISIMRSCSSYCGMLWSCNSPAGIEAVTRRCCPCLPRCLLCLYHSRFAISRNVFFTKCSFAGTKCRKSLLESKNWKFACPAKFFL